MKLVSALSKRGMSPEDYRSMDMDLRRELWEHCNELIYQMLAKSLGHKYSYLLAREWRRETAWEPTERSSS